MFFSSRRVGFALISATLLVVLSMQGCLYDHRVTQAIQERNRRAREAGGAKLGTGGGSRVAARRVGRVRFYVSDAYRRQHPGWQRQLEDLVERANGVLGPSFGVRLEVSELHAWVPRCNGAELAPCLEELSELEPADEREWLVGVLPAFSQFTTSFDELGMALVPGQHLVLRDVADLAERAAIDRAFPTHTREQRDDIYAHRKDHKRLAVFLHEWAHALGALHAVSGEGLLHPSYDDRMTDYDPANAGLVHAALDDAFSDEKGHEALLSELRKVSSESFVASERDALIARLEAAPLEPEHSEEDEAPAQGAAAASAPGAHPFVLQGNDAELLAGVADAERAAYREAVRLLRAEEPQQALTVLTPLVTKHEGCYAVQHLACGLTMQLGLQSDMQLTCSRAQKLAVKH
jgi:hypothetical protein